MLGKKSNKHEAIRIYGHRNQSEMMLTVNNQYGIPKSPHTNL